MNYENRIKRLNDEKDRVKKKREEEEALIEARKQLEQEKKLLKKAQQQNSYLYQGIRIARKFIKNVTHK